MGECDFIDVGGRGVEIGLFPIPCLSNPLPLCYSALKTSTCLYLFYMVKQDALVMQHESHRNRN